MDRPLDVLVITPTDDEFLVCESILYANWTKTDGRNHTFSPLKSEKIPLGAHDIYAFKVGRVDELMVGLLKIGVSGNLNAALECFSVIDVYRPKAVFLTGIAAGKSPEKDSDDRLIQRKVLVGDVVCNNQLIYSSYGKTLGKNTARSDAGKKKTALAASKPVQKKTKGLKNVKIAGYDFEYRKMRYDVVPHSFVTGTVARIIELDNGLESDSGEWQSLAKYVFRQFRSKTRKLRQWKSADHRWSPEDYPHTKEDRQGRPPKKSSYVHLVDIASGEMVLASDEFQAHLRRAVRATRGPEITVQAFEMEAYGIARICASKSIPFLTVRGVSDPGDGKKDPKQTRLKDADHLAAACLGAAYTRRIIRDPEVQKFLDKAPRSSDNLLMGVKPPIRCLDHKVGSGCPYDPPYRCLATDNHGTMAKVDGTKVDLVHVYEDLEPHRYSQFLAKLFGVGSAGGYVKYQVLLLYPYTGRETIDFCSVQGTQVPRTGRLTERADALAANRREVLKLMNHFLALEQYASGVDTCVERLILGDKVNLSNIDKQIYGALLGGDEGNPSRIKTYYVNLNDQNARNWIRDDVVLIRALAEDPDTAAAGPIAFRYSTKSKLLVIRGWPCPSAGGLATDERDFLSGLVRDWNDENNDWRRFAKPIEFGVVKPESKKFEAA